jgi:hypothetical protein
MAGLVPAIYAETLLQFPKGGGGCIAWMAVT